MKTVFSLIEIHFEPNDYDCESASHFCSFDTEEEAKKELNKIQKDISDSVANYDQYVEKFIDKINLPVETGDFNEDYRIWELFLKDYEPFGDGYTFPINFKNHLKSFLIGREVNFKNPKKINFNSPKKKKSRTIFIVKIEV